MPFVKIDVENEVKQRMETDEDFKRYYEEFDKERKERKLITRKDGLTEQEGKVMDNLVSAWNEYIKLEKQHPSDMDDFCDGIHKCQCVLTMRVLRRDYPLGYSIYKK